MIEFGTDSLLKRRKAANAVMISGQIQPASRSSGIGEISRARSAAIRAAAFAVGPPSDRVVASSASLPGPMGSLMVSAPTGPSSSGSMAGWPAAVAVIARNAMWMEARMGSANGRERDNDRATTSPAATGIYIQPTSTPPRYHMWDSQSEYGMTLADRIG